MTVRVHYHKNGQKYFEQWLIDDQMHRTDGPAYLYWYDTGLQQCEGWRINGKYHRIDGPAYRYWYHDGRLHYEAWWINGNDLKNKELEEYKLWLDTYNLFNKNYQLWSDEEKILWKLRWN